MTTPWNSVEAEEATVEWQVKGALPYFKVGGSNLIGPDPLSNLMQEKLNLKSHSSRRSKVVQLFSHAYYCLHDTSCAVPQMKLVSEATPYKQPLKCFEWCSVLQ